MFGLGKNRRRARNDTFAPNRLRNAALAGVGMLAWRWWRNRQETGRTTADPANTFSERSTPPSDTL